jgi:putative membrane protein
MTQRIPFLRYFNWRLMLVRFIIHAVTLVIVVAITPGISFVDPRFGSVIIMTTVWALLAAIVRPIVQILTFQFFFATYGLIVVLINWIILILMAELVPGRFAVGNLLWAFVGAALLSLITFLLEGLFGATVPIVPDTEPELRERVEATGGLSLERIMLDRQEAQAEEEAAAAALAAGAGPETAAMEVESASGPDETEQKG